MPKDFEQSKRAKVEQQDRERGNALKKNLSAVYSGVVKMKRGTERGGGLRPGAGGEVSGLRNWDSVLDENALHLSS